MERYIGIDLSWGGRTTTAAVVLEAVTRDPKQGAQFVSMVDDLGDDEAILDFVKANDTGEDLLIGIDAPTIVTNRTGRRPCEAVLARCLRKQEAGPHPANRNLLEREGKVRGEEIVQRLSEYGISHSPYLEGRQSPVRAVFEVFPHPAHIALFGLDRTMKYKVKPGRTLEQRLTVFRTYTRLLEDMREADPPLFLPDTPDSWMKRDPATLGTAALKRHEDAMDALTCAYVALYRRVWGEERCPAVGDLTNGYIVTPASEEMQLSFRELAETLNVPIG